MLASEKKTLTESNREPDVNSLLTTGTMGKIHVSVSKVMK